MKKQIIKIRKMIKKMILNLIKKHFNLIILTTQQRDLTTTKRQVKK